jgi:hypothetical protein
MVITTSGVKPTGDTRTEDTGGKEAPSYTSVASSYCSFSVNCVIVFAQYWRSPVYRLYHLKCNPTMLIF